MKWKFLFCLSFFYLIIVRAKYITDYEYQWKQFKIEFHKNYKSEAEETIRREIFAHNVQEIIQHNERFDKGEVSYKRRINQLADMGDNEIPNPNWSMYDADSPMYMELPTNFDWRDKGAVTQVKDQKECDEGDWAFAATGALEAQLYMKNKSLISLSEQELLDCPTEGSYGCGGGNVRNAFYYIEKNGISTETSYPYKGQTTTCPNSLTNKVAKGCKILCDKITKDSETRMAQTLILKGPIMAIIDHSLDSFKEYTTGIYQDENCGKMGRQNVLIVGYGETDTKEKFWIVKNSWGEDWGDKGYIKIAREKNNTCGIATNASYIEYNQ